MPPFGRRRLVIGAGLLVVFGAMFLMKTFKKSGVTRPECVRIGLPKLYASYDPAELFTTPQYFVINALMGRLVDMGENNEVYSGIAKRWSIAESRTEFTFFLDPKARFSDGTPVTSADVAASIKRAILFGGTHLQIGSKILGASAIKAVSDEAPGIQALDRLTLRLTLNSPEPMFLYWLSFPEMGVIPANEASKPRGSLGFRVTSGAFAISTAGKDGFRLISNPNFYGERGTASGCLALQEYPTAEEAIAGLSDGKIDLLDYGATLDPEFGKFLTDPRFSVTSEGSKALIYLVPNPRRALFANRNSRRWFLAKMDSKDFIPYGPGTIFKPAEQFLTKQHQGHLSSAQAQSIREDMATSPPPPPGVARELKVLYPAVFGQRFKQILSSGLARIHPWRVVIKTYGEGDLIPAVKKDDYDILFVLAGMSEKDTGVLLSYHFQKEFPLYRFRDEGIVSSLEQALGTSAKSRRSDLYRDVSRRLLEEARVVPIAYFGWPRFHRSDLAFDRHTRFQFQAMPWSLSWRKSL